ncbi:MAG: stage II sporulation protein M [Oscillibacter sp.]|nr:stage II sporulation protein M [Oscillibacter sp.]
MISPLRRNYASLKDCWNSGLKEHFVLSTAAFFILVVIFFLLGMFVPQVQENFMALTEAAMSGAVSEDGSVDGIFLLTNNITACGMIMLYGFLPFIRFSALAIGTNAMMLGCMAALYVQNGFSMLTYFAGILLHGILELPAMFLSFAMGLYICDNVSRFFRRDTSACTPWTCAVWLARFHLLVLIPLLTGAALLEVYVTPLVMGLFP